MCGISGIVSKEPISRRLLSSIRSQEYRGYDSCGMGTLHEGRLHIRKSTGGVDEVNEKEDLITLEGRLGIAHTRWATHGGVTAENAHPHHSMNGEFALAHNGIISNYQELREELLSLGFSFCSQTDTEVLVNLVQHLFQQSGNVEEAFVTALNRVQGSYAVIMMTPHLPETLFCAKHESPLVIGLGNGEHFIGSDINAFLEYTRRAVVLEDGEYAVITHDAYEVRQVGNRQWVDKAVLSIDWDTETTKKGGFAHYMLKEIFDEPQTIRQALKVPRGSVEGLARLLEQAGQGYLMGVGTTFYVAQIAQYLFSNFCGRYFPAISSDEFSDVSSIGSGDAVIAISQSGETYDTKTALQHAQRQGAKTGAVVNVMGSSISMMVDHVIMQGSGPEICVVSTKAALAQVILLMRTALELGRQTRKLSAEQERTHLAELEALPEVVESALNEKSGFLRNLARATHQVEHWLFLGCGLYYPVAMESALKMKEVTYQHAEGMPAGFLKHGTLSLIEPSVHSLFFIPPPEQKSLHNRTLIAMEEIRTRGGTVVGFCAQDDERAQGILHHAVTLPSTPTLTAPLLQMVLAQLLSYYTALELKREIDKPRNLAKSVTVG
jgi:glucosamine--fructose-6-phosphate aminotransferase (isomerizing)